MSGYSKWGNIKHERDVAREAINRRTDPRLELIAFVTPGVEKEVRQRLQAVADELIDLTGDVVVIQRYELAKVVYLDGSERDPTEESNVNG
jgi:hypothetical protein